MSETLKKKSGLRGKSGFSVFHNCTTPIVLYDNAPFRDKLVLSMNDFIKIRNKKLGPLTRKSFASSSDFFSSRRHPRTFTQCDQTFFSEPATLGLKNGHLLNTDRLKTATHRPETGHYVMNSPNFSGHTNPKNGQVGRKRPRLVTLLISSRNLYQNKTYETKKVTKMSWHFDISPKYASQDNIKVQYSLSRGIKISR